MLESIGYAAASAGSRLTPFSFQRRDPRPSDVVIEILYCGVCRSDLHFVNNDWNSSTYPMVPGHEIVGRIARVGSAVRRFSEGDTVAIGCVVDSCRSCTPCETGNEHRCEQGPTLTYNSYDRETKDHTYGGYSNNYVIDERFALRVPSNLDPAAAAPLVCAGITTYSPLRHWRIGPGQRVGIIGVGGLGHVAIKFAHAIGSEVVVFTTSASKGQDARRLGAEEVILSTEAAQMKGAGKFDFILDTVSAQHDVNSYLRMLKNEGVMCMVGLPPVPLAVGPWDLAVGRKSLAGSDIGGLAETQEMLDFCGRHNITAEIELIRIEQINDAFERLERSDLKYRFVVDSRSLKEAGRK